MCYHDNHGCQLLPYMQSCVAFKCWRATILSILSFLYIFAQHAVQSACGSDISEFRNRPVADLRASRADTQSHPNGRRPQIKSTGWPRKKRDEQQYKYERPAGRSCACRMIARNINRKMVRRTMANKTSVQENRMNCIRIPCTLAFHEVCLYAKEARKLGVSDSTKITLTHL